MGCVLGGVRGLDSTLVSTNKGFLERVGIGDRGELGSYIG